MEVTSFAGLGNVSAPLRLRFVDRCADRCGGGRRGSVWCLIYVIFGRVKTWLSRSRWPETFEANKPTDRQIVAWPRLLSLRRQICNFEHAGGRRNAIKSTQKVTKLTTATLSEITRLQTFYSLQRRLYQHKKCMTPLSLTSYSNRFPPCTHRRYAAARLSPSQPKLLSTWKWYSCKMHITANVKRKIKIRKITNPSPLETTGATEHQQGTVLRPIAG